MNKNDLYCSRLEFWSYNECWVSTRRNHFNSLKSLSQFGHSFPMCVQCSIFINAVAFRGELWDFPNFFFFSFSFHFSSGFFHHSVIYISVFRCFFVFEKINNHFPLCVAIEYSSPKMISYRRQWTTTATATTHMTSHTKLKMNVIHSTKTISFYVSGLGSIRKPSQTGDQNGNA